MCFATAVLAALETPETTLLKIPIGRPRIPLARLLFVVLLVVLLLELLDEPKSDFRMLVRVVLEELLVVRASDAPAEGSSAAMHSDAASRSVAMRDDLECRENIGREFMRSLLVCGPACR